MFVEEYYKNLREFVADRKIRTMIIKLFKTEDYMMVFRYEPKHMWQFT